MAPEPTLEDLVRRYAQDPDAFRQPEFNELQTRKEFLDPLFELLGWDVGNTRHRFSQNFKDVVLGETIRVRGGTKAPDYTFRIGGTRVFFVEAKKPSIDIAADKDAAFQLRRYGWSAKLAISVLTNFRQLAIYDCRVRPSSRDRASVARIRLINSEDFQDAWGEIAGLVSKEAVQQGSIDRFVKQTTAPMGPHQSTWSSSRT